MYVAVFEEQEKTTKKRLRANLKVSRQKVVCGGWFWKDLNFW